MHVEAPNYQQSSRQKAWNEIITTWLHRTWPAQAPSKSSQSA